MRERAAATVASLALAGILLLNFKGPSDAALVTAINSASPEATAGTAGNTSGSSGSTPAPTASGSTGSSSTATGTYTGPLVANPYGDVQVQITVTNGKITDVQALALPTGGHSGRISSFVAPLLRTQALTAQSAAIDGVSGATYTSQAYAESLQGALDAAGL